MYLITTPWWLRKLFSPDVTWEMPADKNEIFLTFDDGPHPAITPFVLKCLKQYHAKATFFCIGKNVQQHPEIYQQILDEGHAAGNHTQNHLNGWKTDTATYLKNVVLAKEAINSKLFRPPYGRITRSQAKELSPAFKIMMWSVLSGDFDVRLAPEKCLHNVISNVSLGSVIVFHDSEKAFARLEYALPKALDFFSQKGYAMKAIRSS